MITNNNEQNNYLTTKSKFIEIVCEKEKVLINLNEVMYIERDARKVRFVTKGCEYASYISLASLIKRLPDNFVRCHTGYIVNMDYVVSIHSNYLVINDGYKISIGRTYKSAVTTWK